MILTPNRPSILYILLTLQGSILPQIWRRVLYTVILSVAVNYTHGYLYDYKVTMTPALFTIMGLTLAIFLGFRNTASHDRFWEGRKLWGEAVIGCRNLARQLITFAPVADAAAVRYRVYLTIAFGYALKHHLRRTDPLADLQPLLQPLDLERVLAAQNRPNALLQLLGQACARWKQEGLDAQLLARMDSQISELVRVQAGCERIQGTPIPHPYLLLLHRTVHAYCFLLPFALTDSIGMLTPVVVGIASYTFFGLDAIGDEIADPFDELPHDLPLNAISRTIDINLREQLGEVHLPEPVLPRNNVLM